ncbi:GGDEF domain-containing protein [Hydrogenophaga sp. OTU3427]|uniref:GGDEF domain-containing protein n=1 Tax=Hydrogenophaga sp. OTU3427 TaxID=3043856 RepID=UPI00313C3496
MHIPTLLILAAMLMGIMCGVLFAVWHFNRRIPGLQAWAMSYLFGFCVSVALLGRDQMPELVSVVITQLCLFLAAYCSVVGVRAYVGLPALPMRWPVMCGVLLCGLGFYFTALHPHMGVRVLIGSSVAGALYLLSAHNLSRGSTARQFPARHLVATAYTLHGLFLVARPWLFQLGGGGANPPSATSAISQFIVLETIIALILLAFGSLMLTNEFITRELRHVAEKDFLTGAFNRRAFLALLEKACSLAHRSNATLPVLLLDLDHFKHINDSFGHKVGDQMLRHFVAVTEPCLRKEDVLGRMGGEEFAIFLPNASPDDAHRVSERLRAMVASQPLLTERGPVSLTVSIGVTQCLPGEAPELALHRADQAMYQAKQRGRNRTESLATVGV